MTRSAAPRSTLIVGGGTAGSVLAARLSEDPTRCVTLLEAGPAGDTPAELLTGATLPGAVPGHPVNWGYEAELTPGSRTIVPRGRLLGGSSAINGGYFVRARPEDFARWAAVGGPQWSYEAALPLLRAFENDLDFGHGCETPHTEPLHGGTGPIRVKRPDPSGELTAAFTAAARGLGFADELDKNSAATPGVGQVPSNIVDGVRTNAAMAYLAGARQRPNLTILGGHRVTRVRFDGARAVGVEALVGGPGVKPLTIEPDAVNAVNAVNGLADSTRFFAADEIVLCAGSVATPQLLMLSGIGPRDALAAHDISLIADLPVGKEFHDHPNLALFWQPTRRLRNHAADAAAVAFPTSLNFDSSGSARRHPEGDLEILLTGVSDEELFGGSGSDISGCDVSGGLNSVGDDGVGDNGVRDSSACAGGAGADDGLSESATMRLIIALQQPLSRGRLSLCDRDPRTPPRIEYRYLEHPDDRSRLRLGVRTAVDLLRSQAFSGVFGGLVSLDERTLADDARLDDWVRAQLGTAIHMCGTAALGSVVDSAGHVYGVSGLRVADTSILPTAPSRGPFNTAVFIGEFIARAMRS